MPYNADVVSRVRRLLAARGDLRGDLVEKRMVGGGLSFNVAGAMCCGVLGDDLMVRVGAAALESTLARPHVRPMIVGKRRLAGFVLIESPGFATEQQLRAWIDEALDFVSKVRS